MVRTRGVLWGGGSIGVTGAGARRREERLLDTLAGLPVEKCSDVVDTVSRAELEAAGDDATERECSVQDAGQLERRAHVVARVV